MMGYYGNYNTGFDFLGVIIMVIFWILIIWGIVMLIRWVTCPGGNCRHRHHMMGQMGGHMGEHKGMGEGSGSAIRILRERYAKGEISKEEYEERKKVLMGLN